MTYCVGLCLRDGLVLLSDTRTNAGVDNISSFRKMHVVEEPGERVIVAMTAGNLAITQAVMSLVTEGPSGPGDETAETLYNVQSMVGAARLVGNAIRKVHDMDGPGLSAHDIRFDVSVLLAGQIAGRRMRLFQIYAAGNFIEAEPETPFLQIGEHKYGKPILDRALSYDTDLYDGVKLVLVSMDSTLRSNLTVGMPIDLLVYRRDALKVELQRRINDEDAYFQSLREGWSNALREAYLAIPPPDWKPAARG
ncbi:MAG: peptidase [Alphaproteobacteria bacterium]